jgi:AraC family carnitine catabolism transcriptional activator
MCVSQEMSLVSALLACEPFRSANRVSGRLHYDVDFIGAEVAPVVSGIGIAVTPDKTFGDDTRFDLVIVMASYDQDLDYKKQLFSWLRRQDRFGAKLCGVDYGACLLAEAGLLDGYKAASHWDLVPSMREKFPRVEASDSIYVVDRNRLTCGGYVSSIDLFLTVVGDDFGASLMRDVAADLIYGSVGEGQSRQSAPLAVENFVHHSKVSGAIALMNRNLEEPLSITQIAMDAEISVRQLQELFVRHTGESPSIRYLNMRLQRACQILMYTDMSIVSVAAATGFNSASSFCRAFRKKFGNNAGRFRRDFQTSHSRMLGSAGMG